MDDELELEVSDLRTGRAVRKSFGSLPEPSTAREDGDNQDGEHLPMDEDRAPHVESLGGAAVRGPAGALLSRRVRGYAVVALTLLVCAGILLSLPGPQASIRQALAGPTPTPTATLAPGADVVYFAQSVPWGQLTLDGKPPVSVDQQAGHSNILPPGRHTLAYAAAPWSPLRCQISAPAQQGDTCSLDTNIHYDKAGMSRVIDLGATPEKLPEAQRTALTSAVASGLQANAATAEVPTGDHYLGADGTPAIAAEPLRAALVVTLNTDPARAALNDLPPHCVILCEMGGGGEIDWWIIITHAIVRWQFMTAGGAVIQPDASADLDVGYTVGAQWADGAWKTTLTPFNSQGGTAGLVGLVGQLCWPVLQRGFSGNSPIPDANGWSTRTAAGPTDADGCVEVVSPGNGGGGGIYNPNATPTPLPSDAAIFMARCGAVLAVNDAAHAAQPKLPVASAHERALAQEWLARQLG